MIWVVATILFGLLCLGCVTVAWRSEDERPGLWLAAVVAALVCGISFSSFVQDGQLTARIDTLTHEAERLRHDNAELTRRLGSGLVPVAAWPVDGERAGLIPQARLGSVDADALQANIRPDIWPETLTALAKGAALVNEPGAVATNSATPTGEEEPVALSGVWEMRTTVDETSYPTFLGTELTFRIELAQEGERLRAEGEKLGEQLAGAVVMREYGPAARTPIVLTGEFLDDRQVHFAFEEGGSLRSSDGMMLLTVASPTRLQGRFSSSAAASAGRVTFEKLGPESSAAPAERPALSLRVPAIARE